MSETEESLTLTRSEIRSMLKAAYPFKDDFIDNSWGLSRSQKDDYHATQLSNLLADIWVYLEGQSPLTSSNGIRNGELVQRLSSLPVISKA